MASTKVKRVGIVGSGIMGSGIAEVAAKAGHEVVLRSRQQATADAMVAALEKSLAKQVDQGKLDEADATPHARPGHGHRDLRRPRRLRPRDRVGRRGPRRQEGAVRRARPRRAAPDAILATNTSTLPVVELAMETSRPERVCGVHFFNPAPMMALVEIVRPLTADDETIETVRAFATPAARSRSR